MINSFAVDRSAAHYTSKRRRLESGDFSFLTRKNILGFVIFNISIVTSGVTKNRLYVFERAHIILFQLYIIAR